MIRAKRLLRVSPIGLVNHFNAKSATLSDETRAAGYGSMSMWSFTAFRPVIELKRYIYSICHTLK